MTKKLAVFVEGQTECIFVHHFISEFGNKSHITFQVQGKANGLTTFTLINAEQEKYIVLLVDCGNDESVKSTIIDQWTQLRTQGYSQILGIRDLYPSKIEHVSLVESRLRVGLPTGPPNIEIILAVAEIEAWFLQDHSHYSRIDSRLCVSGFKAQFGFDPCVESAELIPHPTRLLKAIYNSVGTTYSKKKRRVTRTVSALDVATLCFDCEQRIPQFRKLVDHFEAFFA